MAGKIQDADVKGSSEVTADSRLVNDNKIYVSSLGKRLDQAVAAGDLGADSSNYVSALNNEISVSGTVYADAAATSPVDGTGGSASVTWANSGSSPLRGSQSKLFIKDAANRQGQGFSYDFTIAPADTLKVLQCSFNYAVASGTYASGDVTFWIYDVTNSLLIQPSPTSLQNHSLTSERFSFEFQSSTSTSYRLIGHVSTTSALAYSLKFDDFKLGPQAKLYGSPVTDWQSFTPTGSWTTNTTYSGRHRRLGDQLEVAFLVSTSGTPTTATLTVNLPSGLSIDTAKLVATTSTILSRDARVLDSGVQNYLCSIHYSSTTAVSIKLENAASTNLVEGNNVSESSPMAFGAGDSVRGNFRVPIVGWGSSVVMSNDANTRLVSMRATATSTAAVPDSATTFVWGTVVKDSHGAYNSSTGVYTVAVPGDYVVEPVLKYSGSVINSYTVTVRVNGTNFSSFSIPQQVAASFQFVASRSVLIPNLKAGDTIDVQSSESVNNASYFGTQELNIYKISGPSQIAASESVTCSYSSSATTAITNAGMTPAYATKIFDSHNAFNTSTGVFTAPISGVYSVSVQMLTAATSMSAGDQVSAYVWKNGSNYKNVGFKRIDATINARQGCGGTTLINLLAGETCQIRLFVTTSTSMSGNADENHVSITRVGNYA